MSDPITIIEIAFKTALKGVAGVTSVLSPEDLSVRDRDYPAVLIDAGEIVPGYPGGEEAASCHAPTLAKRWDVTTAAANRS